MSTQSLIESTVTGDAHAHDGHDTGSRKVLGLWIYLMSDCILFGSLFASYAVLSGAFAGGPGPKDIFELPTPAPPKPGQSGWTTKWSAP